MDRIASMPASQTRSISYRIGEAASGGLGAISQPANQSESGNGMVRYARAGFSAAGAARAVIINLSNEKRNEHVAVRCVDRLERRLQEDAMTVSKLFAVACGLSL